MAVLDWLLDSDPTLRWRVLRDLTDAPLQAVSAERARVAIAGWGARLVALRGEDGQWTGGACFPADFRGDFSKGQPCLDRDAAQPDVAPGISASIRRPSRCVRWSRWWVRPAVGSTPGSGSSTVRWSRASMGVPSRSAPISGWTSTALWSGCSASSSRMAGGIARPKRLGACIVRDNDLRARGIARARADDRRFVAGRRGAPQRRAVPARPVVVPTAEHKGVRTGRAAGTIVGHESRRARPTRVHVPLPARRTGPAHPRLRPLRGVRRCLMRIQWPPSQRGGRSTSS